MAEAPAPSEVGFAEFVAKLISEVFEAIVTSQIDQEKRLSELAAAADLDFGEFAERFVTYEQVELELARLFPGDDAQYPSAIYVGAPYRPKQKGLSEMPPVYAQLGITLLRTDYTVKQRRARLNASGVEKIIHAVREQLAKEQYAAMQQVMGRGVPRVIVDASRVNAKLTYEVISTEDGGQLERAKHLAEPLQPIGRDKFFREPTVLSKLRMLVRPADERSPQNQKLQVNVFGEVEINLKTIT